MSEHDTIVTDVTNRRGSETWEPRCICGWVGERCDEDGADAQAAMHRETVALLTERNALHARVAELETERDEALKSCAAMREVLKGLTAWCSRWRGALVIRAIGGATGWDELEAAHNAGVKALAKARGGM